MTLYEITLVWELDNGKNYKDWGLIKTSEQVYAIFNDEIIGRENIINKLIKEGISPYIDDLTKLKITYICNKNIDVKSCIFFICDYDMI